MTDQINSRITKNRMIRLIRRQSRKAQPQKTDVSQKGDIQNIKAVIFDIYGTLFISGSGDIGTAKQTRRTTHFSQTLSTISEEAIPSHWGERAAALFDDTIQTSHQETKKQLHTSSPEVNITAIWKKILVTLKNEGCPLPEITPESIQETALNYELRANPVYPMPCSLEVIDNLNQRGITLGIVSNAQFYTPLMFEAFFEKTTEQLGFKKELTIYSCNESRSKPDTALFFKLKKSLETHYQLSPEECLYIGNDMLNDVWCASQAGFKTCLFAGDQRSLRKRENDSRTKGISADIIITELIQVLSYIKIPKANEEENR